MFGNSNLQQSFTTDNYDEANYLSGQHSIKMPVFSIHGNHDDPVGLEQLSTLDQLSCNHYINYFGKVTNIEKFIIKPVLLSKGNTKIALYGIGHMKDERLNIAFENGKIQFERPINSQNRVDETWFNILVLHQNKYKGVALGASRKSCVMEETIPSWFDFVVWGHEHESIP